MVAATGYDLLKFVRNPEDATNTLPGSNGVVVLIIGFVVSFLVAYAAVAWFMAWVRKHGFVPFAVYRIVVGILVLAYAAKLAG